VEEKLVEKGGRKKYEEVHENGKESSHFAHANVMNECNFPITHELFIA
jgi:hypothetical protein